MGTSLASLAVAYGAPYQPPGPGGSGRYRSYIYPDPFVVAANSGSVASVPGTRGRNSTGGPALLFHGYGGSSAVGLINGIAGYIIQGAVGGGGGWAFQGNICQLKTSKSLIVPGVDETSVIRLWANLACSAGPPGGNDQGFVLVHPGGTAQRIFADLAIGFGFQIGQNGVVDFVIRGPNGLITQHCTAAPFDITVHHTYEMWLVGATAGADATLAAFIDNVPVALPALSRSWAAGSNLPPNVFISGESNFVPQVTGDTKSVSTTHIQQVGIVWGPTLPSCA